MTTCRTNVFQDCHFQPYRFDVPTVIGGLDGEPALIKAIAPTVITDPQEIVALGCHGYEPQIQWKIKQSTYLVFSFSPAIPAGSCACSVLRAERSIPIRSTKFTIQIQFNLFLFFFLPFSLFNLFIFKPLFFNMQHVIYFRSHNTSLHKTARRCVRFVI